MQKKNDLLELQARKGEELAEAPKRKRTKYTNQRKLKTLSVNIEQYRRKMKL